MIESKIPETWVDLQNEVARIFLECGFEAETPKTIDTVRGKVKVDVYAVDNSIKPAPIYLCECKHWTNAIPQTIIHAFRTIVSDYGANWGMIISLKGYQSGSYEAIKNTNVRLLDWFEFQSLFEERWYREYFQKQISNIAEPLIDYTEPINSRIFRKADLLTPSAQEEFRRLRNKYGGIAFFALSLYIPLRSNELVKLPLNSGQSKTLEAQYLPPELLVAVAYRDVLQILMEYINRGLEEFDSVFGCRA